MPEVPLEQAHETIEHQAHHTSEPWVLGVALTAAVLAALAAVTALYAEHFAYEAMMERIEGSDRWNEFEANSIKEKVVRGHRDLAADRGKSDSSDDAELAKYLKNKDELSKKAEALKEESLRHLSKHLPLSYGLTMFQVAIAVSAISALTKRREFWFVAIAFGVMGVGFLGWAVFA